MSGLNIISEINLTQMDRHQNDIHRNPVVNQEQNAQIAKNETQKKMKMPIEPDKTENKIVDSKQRRDEKKKKKRKKSDGNQKRKNTDTKNGKGNSGYFVDLEA